jgi:SAM-dependent methyltransferase
VKEDIKRVIFVGGGDSGVLNEFLKYPSLELVIGLELDQFVTRLSFKHFKSRPHFDNPKVQWWYGDASKSLLMLPNEYFGTFDVVVVDLSDTVFSLSVTSELDVIEAISLLLKPGGVFEMNELFFKKVSDVFEYAIHYSFTDVPKICDQSVIFASNEIDFMYQPLTEHELVENATLLVEKDSMKSDHQFHRIHDFRRNPNPTSHNLCNQNDEAQKEKVQEQASGILMIVEAEKLTGNLDSPDAVIFYIVDALEAIGIRVVSTHDSSATFSKFILMLNEGYLVIRLWPDFKYCALDIHLWSAFDKHDEIKQAVVVKALGGDLLNESTSFYRIVTGGMFGIPSWEEDAILHGPQISRVCSSTEAPMRDLPSDAKIFELALQMSLDLIQETDITVAILCDVDTENCDTIHSVKGFDNVKHVIPFHLCPRQENESYKMQEMCTQGLAKKTLIEAFSIVSKIHAIIYDPNSSAMVNTIMDSIGELIDVDDLLVLTTTDSKTDIWRRRALDVSRLSIKFDPIFAAQVLLNTTTSSLEVGYLASGDEYFFERLTKMVSTAQDIYPDITIEIRNVLGGRWREEKQHMSEDWEFSQVTVEDDYDNKNAKAQWESQVPLATQSMTQYINTVDGEPVKVNNESFVRGCSHAFESVVAQDVHVYRNVGEGLVCSGVWETGTAVLLWDGRFQVDFNLFSENDTEELKTFTVHFFEGAEKLNLKQKLLDVQPRGYGRVVNFKSDLDIAT